MAFGWSLGYPSAYEIYVKDIGKTDKPQTIMKIKWQTITDCEHLIFFFESTVTIVDHEDIKVIFVNSIW